MSSISITKGRAAFQSIQAHHGGLEERVQKLASEKTRFKEQQDALAVEAASLEQKSEYLQKWQEKLEMQEKILNSTASRLQKRETDVAKRETRLRDKAFKFKNIHREALKLLTDAKTRAKVVASDIEAFEAEFLDWIQPILLWRGFLRLGVNRNHNHNHNHKYHRASEPIRYHRGILVPRSPQALNADDESFHKDRQLHQRVQETHRLKEVLGHLQSAREQQAGCHLSGRHLSGHTMKEKSSLIPKTKN